ncbi:histidine kinase [Salinarchaeum sp. Harcht-Bsk1]|uniref:sensor histidine kinase n=1 Tax=Salinarchaeum sp. Harcht-Bsk1 TaxID=1333523 RepID=UPI0003423EAA|nr:HAMP domain-containing sensor histidine kinase [Salinarchaeum sp. Harcht-Bsk1]AGN00462.1 histidine kinase [Salinarchaeum sp. Harcht-Bsk1]
MAEFTPYSGSPLDIAVVYGIVSGAWILVSDRLVAALIDDPELTTTIQTAKGWLFVLGSALLLFGLIRHGQRSTERTNERLDRALQQTTILHRVLRHNLRNSCNVIAGNTELLAARADGGEVEDVQSREYIEPIREQTDELVTLTEKTRLLRDIVLEDELTERVDLDALLEERIDEERNRYPSATFELQSSAAVTVETDPRLHRAVDELLENAVVHCDHDEPTIQVAVEELPDGTARFDVADDGPGLPEVERALLEEGMESPMFHSEGLGLWITRSIVDNVDGDVTIVDNEPRGTIVRITLPQSGGRL